MTVDIVMPTHNNRDELRSALEALQLSAQNDLSVLICVDGSTDGTLEYLAGARFPFRVRTLQHEDRRNHGRGSDCVSVRDVVYENVAGNLWAKYLGTRGHHKSTDGAEIRPLDFHTANAAMRTADVLSVGGFDETLVGYGGEDTEFGLRLAALGRRFVFNAAARALTVETKSVDEGLAQLRRYAQTNLQAIRQKHPDSPAPFWIDRLESNRLKDRALRALLNPVTDAAVDLALPVMPFAVQRQLLNYKVIRAVFRGYREGAA